MAKASPRVIETPETAAQILARAATYRHNLNTVFRDFVRVIALALQNGFEPRTVAWETREAEYLEIVGRYEREIVDAFADCLRILRKLAKQGYGDHLGEMYMALGTSSKGLGQFFTPYQVSYLMTSLALDEKSIAAQIAETGYFTMNEPTCGAGGMIIAAAQVLKERGFDPSKHMRVVAQDIDRACTDMTYAAATLHKIPAQIIHGDALKLEERSFRLTPALIAQLMEESKRSTTGSREAA